MNEGTLALMIPIFSVIGGIVIVIVAIVADYRKTQMIEKGIEIPMKKTHTLWRNQVSSSYYRSCNRIDIWKYCRQLEFICRIRNWLLCRCNAVRRNWPHSFFLVHQE